MKFLVLVSTIDLKYRLGCTPSWWQLLKALHEIGNEIIVIPYLGKPVESLWWRIYENPCSRESVIFNSYLERKRKRGKAPSRKSLLSPIFELFIKHYVRPKWKNHLMKILEKEKDIDVILMLNVPINHIEGIPSKIKKDFSIPIAYCDGDMPTILPEYALDRGFKFNYYEDADLSEFDAFFSNSKGVIPDLEERGAKNVHPLYWAVDPMLFTPVSVEKDIDISFFGYGSEYREEWMTKMITNPSKKMPEVNFTIGGGNFKIDLGNAKLVGDIPYSAFRNFCCRSKINLNITRWSHTNIYASSTSRPFELAAYGACIVSQPYNGIEEWFKVGKELFVVNSEEEAIENYKWLLDDGEEREKAGNRARERILKEHTFQHRAKELIKVIKGLKK
ncbi:MAG: glycosyltransferase [Candidatus Lokiarchaeia archaeon]